MAVKISVVITSFNYARFVGGAIDSVLEQDYVEKEVIVVDDGSTDNTIDVISVYGERLRVIRQNNQGQAEAGYTGFKISKGEIVLFLDADDWLLPGALTKIAAKWRIECAKVQYDLAIIDGQGRNLGRKFCNFTEVYNADSVRRDFRELGLYTSPVMSGNAYSRWFLEQILPLQGTRVLDGVPNAIAPLYGDIVTIPQALGCYRLHGANFDNQGSGVSDAGRFVKSIERRYEEIAALRNHAEKKGEALPAGNLLNNDLVFVNYRLMLKKQRVSYKNDAQDSISSLLRRAIYLTINKPTPVTAKLVHMAWFLVFAALPRFAVMPAISLRYNRANFLKTLHPAKG